MSKFIKLSVFFVFFVLALTSVTYAREEDDVSPEPTKVNSTDKQQFKQFKSSEKSDLENKKEVKSAEKMERKVTQAAVKKEKLSEARLKLCQAKEGVIENRFKTIIALGEKTHTGKEKIITRVDEFYNNNLVPQGYILSNYDALKADIAAKEAVVKTILDEAQANGETFSCDSDDPKAVTDGFRQDIQALIAANKAYRISVRAFVVAVRDLAKQAKSANLSPEPNVSPIISPAVTPIISESPEN